MLALVATVELVLVGTVELGVVGTVEPTAAVELEDAMSGCALLLPQDTINASATKMIRKERIWWPKTIKSIVRDLE